MNHTKTPTGIPFLKRSVRDRDRADLLRVHPGDDGFGEGNFRALFESIEADQIARGVLKPDAA
jgi:hypothetical protein